MSLAGIDAIVNSANSLMNWCMSLMGASLLALLSTSYVKPVKGWSKAFYLLFIPAWILLALAMYNGILVIRSSIMIYLNPRGFNEKIHKINEAYSNQLDYFFISITCLSVWLLCYLIWWFRSDFSQSTEK